MSFQIQRQAPTSTQVQKSMTALNYCGLKTLFLLICIICIIGTWKFQTSRGGLQSSTAHYSGMPKTKRHRVNSKGTASWKRALGDTPTNPRPFNHRPPFNQPQQPDGGPALSQGEYYYNEQDDISSSSKSVISPKAMRKPPPKVLNKEYPELKELDDLRKQLAAQAREMEKLRLDLEMHKQQSLKDEDKAGIKQNPKEAEDKEQKDTLRSKPRDNSDGDRFEFDPHAVNSIQDWNKAHNLNHLGLASNSTGTEIHGGTIELPNDENLFCRRNGMSGVPSVLVIGAMKAGTTTFWSVLKDQPGLNEGKRKESKFFGQNWWRDFMPHRERPLETPEQYADTFGPCDPERHYIDATPLSSALEANPIEDIQKFYTKAEQDKLVFLMIMQEPVHRFVSQYNFQKRPKNQNAFPRRTPPKGATNDLRSRLEPEINDYVEEHFNTGEEADFGLFTRNNYGDIVEAYREAFPKSKIILVQSDYFFGNEQLVMDGIMRELGQSSSKITQTIAKNINQRDKELLSAKNHDRLAEKWRPQIEKLRTLLENDRSGLVGIYPENVGDFIDGLMPWKYCHRFDHTEKQFKENVLPIPTEDANDPKVTADYIYNKYYKENKPFVIKNAARNLFHNYMELNTNFLLNKFDLTDVTRLNEGSGRIVNLLQEKTLMECLLEEKRCVYFRKFHFVKDQDGVRFPEKDDNQFLRPMHHYFASGMKNETFLWGINTTGTYNLHISNRGGALPHSHSQAINILHQGAKRWILVNSRDYHKCENQIDFELHKLCPVTRAYKQAYPQTGGCSFTSDMWIESLEKIEYKHYDFVQEAGDLVFVPMTYTHGTLDLCAPTVGNVFMGDVTAFKGSCLQPPEFKHAPCENPKSMLPNNPKCMKQWDEDPAGNPLDWKKNFADKGGKGPGTWDTLL